MPAEQTKARPLAGTRPRPGINGSHAWSPGTVSSIRLIGTPDVWPPRRRQGCGRDRAGRPRRVQPEGTRERPWPRQFAVLLAEALAGVRPLQQVLPWMSERGSIQLRRLLPLFCGDHRPRIAARADHHAEHPA